MTAYWTCTRCKRVIPFLDKSYYCREPPDGEEPDTIDGARVCRACCKAEIEEAKEKKGDG